MQSPFLPTEGAGGQTAPLLGSGAPRSSGGKPRDGPRGLFDMPDQEEFLKEGEANVEWVKEWVTRLRVEGGDVRSGAFVLGSVSETFPRLRDALEASGIRAARVEGLWVVPPFVMKGLPTASRWHQARGRLGPFLKNELWRRVNAEVIQGRAVDWAKMGLQPENVVVARHRREWRELAATAREQLRQLSWSGTKQAVRDVYAAATCENVRAVLVRAWPFRWSWLVAWLVADLCVWAAHRATADVLPVTWHDVLMLLMANACVSAYVVRARAPADAALTDAAKFKTSGSIALRKGKLDVAAEQVGRPRTKPPDAPIPRPRGRP